MTAKWEALTQSQIGGPLPPVIDSVSNVVDALTSALELATTALEVAKALSLSTLNFLKNIVEAIIALIEELLFDLLEYNTAMSLHVNMNWNPFWVYNKEKERDPRTGRLDPRLVDYQKDGQLPWSGTGLVGWLLDILASSKDPTDPFRPVTDANTQVYGVMIIKGVANPAEAEQSLRLQDWVNLFTDWKGFEPDFGKVTSSEYFDSLSKLGTTAVLNSVAALYQVGPKDKQMLPVEAHLTDEIRKYFPVPGAYPKWVSKPMAALVPPLQGAIEDLRRVLGLLRFADDSSDVFGKLIDALNAKITVLEEGLAQIESALNLLLSLAAFLADSYVIVHETSSGGMDTFISDILAAEDAPNFGTAGIVVGVTLVATQPDSQAAIDKFLQVLGIQVSAYTSSTTAYAEALDETFQDLFP